MSSSDIPIKKEPLGTKIIPDGFSGKNFLDFNPVSSPLSDLEHDIRNIEMIKNKNIFFIKNLVLFNLKPIKITIFNILK